MRRCSAAVQVKGVEEAPPDEAEEAGLAEFAKVDKKINSMEQHLSS